LALAARVMSGILPKFSMDNGLDLSGISRDEAAVQAYIDDPLVHGKGTPRLGVEMMDNAEWSMVNAHEWEPPLLMIHGEADRIVNVDQTRAFFAEVQQQDKELIIYEGGYHESHNDVHYQQVVTDLERWMGQHLP